MRVLHLIDSAGLYGAEKVLFALVAEQRRLGIDAIIGSIRRHDEGGRAIDARAREQGVSLVSFPMGWGASPRDLASVMRYVREERVDVIHSHGYKSNILLGCTRRSNRVAPIVATVHGWMSAGKFGKLWLYEWLDRQMLGRLDAVVFVSHAMRDKLNIRTAIAARATVIHNGIPLSQAAGEWTPLEQVVRNFCGRRFTVGAIGRLSAEKGFELLIRALAVLRDAAVDLQVVILGEGAERGALEGLARELRVDDRLLLAGYVPDAFRLLPSFQVCALTSYTEGLPMVLLEAAGAGVPQVATRVGGVTEVLQDGVSGQVPEPGDVAAIANAIQALQRDPALAARLAQAAARTVKERFSVEAMCTAYSSVYAQALKRLTPEIAPSGR